MAGDAQYSQYTIAVAKKHIPQHTPIHPTFPISYNKTLKWQNVIGGGKTNRTRLAT